MKLSALLFGLVFICALSSAWADCANSDDPTKHWHEKEMDTAWLTFVPSNHSESHNYFIRFVSHNCWRCAPTTEFIGNVARKVRVSSQFPWTITLETKAINEYNETLWEIVNTTDFKFQEYGHYKLAFKPGVLDGQLDVITVASGTFSFLPIIIALSICFGMFLAFASKLHLRLLFAPCAALRPCFLSPRVSTLQQPT